jgi:hypothetical protein
LSLGQCSEYFFKNQIRPQQYVVVPEAQHPITLTLKPLGTCCIFRPRIDVLPTIYLNDQAPFEADEIHDEAA